ncbi:helix-turn-helix transcriptional regulator [uncultured Hyphomonas sp.]|uniref:helix-turn-helix transcriptional regulator n=1 Tax=uncultured Hyphomonas sp. TaxID=225298 RepID=UPI00374A9009
MKHDLVSPAEAAQILKVSPRTIERWRTLSLGPPHVRLGRRVWYRRERLDEYIMVQEQS